MMSIRSTIAVMASVAVLGWVQPLHAALPIPDAIYYGDVTVNGAPASSGYVVSVSFDDNMLQYVVGGDEAADGQYVLRVPLEQMSVKNEVSPDPGAAFPGDQATFGVGTATAATLALAGGIHRLDLAVTDAGPVPPTLTPTPLISPTPTPVGGLSTRTPTRTPSRTPTGPTPTRTGPGGGTPTPTGPTPSPTPTATPGPCAGDCNGSADVTINELISMVNVALGNSPVSACTAGDVNHDDTITINEIISAVAKALNGCTAG